VWETGTHLGHRFWFDSPAVDVDGHVDLRSLELKVDLARHGRADGLAEGQGSGRFAVKLDGLRLRQAVGHGIRDEADADE
jgi:hypothetical protein